MALREPSVVYRGLAEPVLIAGAEPRLILLNVGVMMFMLITVKAWWWAAITWVGHQALKALSKSDPFVRTVYLVYQRQADRYEPWPERAPRRGLRPTGYGRGLTG